MSTDFLPSDWPQEETARVHVRRCHTLRHVGVIKADCQPHCAVACAPTDKWGCDVNLCSESTTAERCLSWDLNSLAPLNSVVFEMLSSLTV